MDNDKQIGQTNIARAREHFLNFPNPDDGKDKDQFDLVGEFEKSSKNRSYRIPVFLLLFVVLLALGAWLISSSTEQANSEATYSIGKFEDLKLKDLLDNARKTQSQFDSLNRQITALKTELDSKIQAIRIDAKNKIDLASINGEATEKIRTINAQAERSIAEEKARLNAQIKPLEEQLSSVQKQLSNNDDRVKEINQQAQAQMDSQQRLFESQKKKLIDEYEARLASVSGNLANITDKMKREREQYVALLTQKHKQELEDLKLKYNPKKIEDALTSLLKSYSAIKPAWPPFEQPARISSLLPEEIQVQLEANFQKRLALQGFLDAIGYENSIPQVFSALTTIHSEDLGIYQKYLPSLSKALEDMDEKVALRDATIKENEAVIADKEETIATQNSTIETQTQSIASKQAEIETAKAAQTKAFEQYSYFANEYVATIKEDGFILDARNNTEILVFIKKEKTALITETTTFSVVDDKKTNIGTVTLTAWGSFYKIKSVNLTNILRPLKVWDKLTLVTKK